jgi:diadenylate cyclase
VDAILDFFYRMGPQERLVVLFELLFIGLFVYIVLTFLEGTRGERLFRGIIFILLTGKVFLTLVVYRFGMERVAFLYNWFLIGILLVAIVAFQPEIRRALIRLGQARFLSSSPQQLSRSVEEIIEAVEILSQTRTGAIMVFEQQVGLGEFIETGVRVDAKVTSELLRTIFYPGTALHDMAVVIQGDRIVAARVQLPLVEGDTIPGRQQLGSRHRAAVGVTLGSDALVIVVSEETGIVSIAMNGNLIRHVASEELRRHLTTAVVETTPLVERLQQTMRGKSPAEEA